MRGKDPLHVLARGIDFQEEVRFCPFYKLLHPAQVGLLVAEVWAWTRAISKLPEMVSPLDCLISIPV